MYLLCTLIFSGNVMGQVKKKTSSSYTRKRVVSPIEPTFNNSVYFVTDYKDVNVTATYYNALKEMAEHYNISFAFADNRFRPDQLLTRGEFCYYLDEVYNKVQNYKTTAGIDTTLINSYDPNRSYITDVSKIGDLKPSSVYYGAVKSLIEDFGVAAPFKKDGRLHSSATISEKEVYDILHVTMDYNDESLRPLLKPISRARFVEFVYGVMTNMVNRITLLGTKKNE